ncbi:geranylgeranyl transferase type-2 subunit alpha, putative [Plasmodium vinckei petteri]|uniref:Geranylgeranyl transferase type-2 subunit alpha n=1 Tax=Plasmodium vinckei petteri TaxID=138298 RepID=A0A6V7TA80_PLAVN|nr:geranylgeranyl transferase type-2 subunit alpha, putative [Plasmodium vinckei petteri]
MHGRKANNYKEENGKLEKVKELIPVVNDLIIKKKESKYEKKYIQMSSAILSKCPYIQTLWNYRKEYFEFIKDEHLNRNEKLPNDTKGDSEGKISEEFKNELKEMMENENSMIEDILVKFSKCNELWFHKLWIIKYCIKNDLIDLKYLLNEIEYCKNSLHIDDRNYHCWNYRSYIISCINIYEKKTKEKLPKNMDSIEINENDKNNDVEQNVNNFNVQTSNCKLSKLLIERNFSNFSAWYLKYSLKEELININEELELIKNAIFTDPSDQSLWEYYRWFLFKKGKHEEEIFFITLENNSFYIFFQNIVKINTDKSKLYDSKNEEICGEWDRQFIINNSGNKNLESCIYIFKVNESVNLSNFSCLKLSICYYKYNIHTPQNINYEENVLQDLVIGYDNLIQNDKNQYNIIYEINFEKFSKNSHFKLLLNYSEENSKEDQTVCKNNCVKAYTNLYKYINDTNIRLNLAKNVNFSLLNLELEQINELLCLESDCKYALFTKYEILKKLERFDEAFEVIDKLKEIDNIRIEYYNDKESELRIQQKVYDYYRSSKNDDSDEILDLSGLNIENIIYPFMIEAFYIQRINLSNNLLFESWSGKCTINFLYNLKELHLRSNKIKQLSILMKNLYNLKLLEILDVSNNELVKLDEELDKYEFDTPPLLKEINISNSNIVLLLNDKYKKVNKLSNLHVTFKGDEVVLLR